MTRSLPNIEDRGASPKELILLGTRIASVTYEEAVALIMEKAGAEQAHAYVCACNVHTVSMARWKETYRRILNGAFLAVPDGKPLVWAHRVLGGRNIKDRVYGPTLMLHLCEAAGQCGMPIYLYGGAAGVAEKLTHVLKAKFPKLKIAGAYSPPFCERERSEDDPALLKEIADINSSGARLVFVALGAPKQEMFMARHAARINPVQIGVGAAFDFHSGRVRQAPMWLQNAGLEWLFRLCCEPRRMWRRYVYYNPYFMIRLALQCAGLDGPSKRMAAEMHKSPST